MGEHLLYRQTSHDTALGSDQAATRLFEASLYPQVDGSARVTELDEKTIVRWLMIGHREVILGELGLPPDASYRTEVVQPFYAPGQGDIDLILWPPLSPHLAFAFQCKRIKVESVNEEQDKINKLDRVAGGVRQANDLYNGPFGFFRTYLCIITEVEASGQDELNIPNRGVRSHTTPLRGDLKRTTFRQIVEFPGRDELHKDIGIIHVEIAQPSRRSIDKQANVRINVYRRAARRAQLDSVTKRVMDIMP